MKTPITDKATANPIGFYSCATVPASTCRAIEASRNELLEALEEFYQVNCKFGIGGLGLEEYQSANAKARAAISKAKG